MQKWNNTITVEIKLGFAHPLLISLGNFSFPEVPPGWVEGEAPEQELSQELCLCIKFSPRGKSPDPERLTLKLL